MYDTNWLRFQINIFGVGSVWERIIEHHTKQLRLFTVLFGLGLVWGTVDAGPSTDDRLRLLSKLSRLGSVWGAIYVHLDCYCYWQATIQHYNDTLPGKHWFIGHQSISPVRKSVLIYKNTECIRETELTEVTSSLIQVHHTYHHIIQTKGGTKLTDGHHHQLIGVTTIVDITNVTIPVMDTPVIDRLSTVFIATRIII